MYDKIVKLVFTIILITQPILIAKESGKTGGQRFLRKSAEIKSCGCGMNHRLGVSIGRDGERTITDTISYYVLFYTCIQDNIKCDSHLSL